MAGCYNKGEATKEKETSVDGPNEPVDEESLEHRSEEMVEKAAGRTEENGPKVEDHEDDRSRMG